jgi:STE20-like kinase
MRKEQLEREHVDRERAFVERLNESHETAMKRLADSHRERIALLDRQFLQQKQQLMRAREVSMVPNFGYRLIPVFLQQRNC